MSEVFKKVVGLYMSKSVTHDLINGDMNQIYAAITSVDATKNLKRAKSLTLDYYQKNMDASSLRFIHPELDLNIEEVFSSSPDSLIRFVGEDSFGLVISTPRQNAYNHNHVEDPIDLMAYQGNVPTLEITNVNFGFDSASYFIAKNFQKAKSSGWPYSMEMPYPFLPVMHVKKVMNQHGYMDFNKIEKVGIRLMPSVFYFYYCQEMGILKNDVSMDMFYDLTQPAILSGYF